MCSTPLDPAQPVSAAQARDALRAAAELAARVDTSELTGTEAQEFAADIAAAQGRLTAVRLDALRVVQDEGSWGFDGSRSMAWALVRTEGTSITTIRNEITLANAFATDLPLTVAALREGTLSLDKAKLIARLAPTSQLRREALRDLEKGEAFLLEQASRLDCWGLSRALRFWAYRVDPDAADRSYRDAQRLGVYELNLAWTPRAARTYADS